MKVSLFTTVGCHLCEQALAQLQQLQRSGVAVEIESVEIADADTLIDQYGIRIPVVKTADGREIGWPFSLDELHRFLVESAS